MILLQVLTGAAAGRRLEVRDFPITAGRGATNALALPDPGVFERHFELQFTPDGFSVRPAGEAALTLNGEPTAGAVLRNGDIIGAGLAKVQFWLGALPQRNFQAREIFTWLLVVAMTAAQIYILFHLVGAARS